MLASLSTTTPMKSAPTLRAMFEARKRVFVDLLKWDVPVLDNLFEVDQFDTPDATYLVLTDDRGRHRASARLLRTDRAHILAQLFPSLCDAAVPRGPQTLEITRFCIEPTLTREERRKARNQLVTALVEHALRFEISEYTAVATRGWHRQIAAFGWKCEALGPCLEIGGEHLVALNIRIDAQTPHDLAATGIYNPSTFQLAVSGGLQ